MFLFFVLAYWLDENGCVDVVLLGEAVTAAPATDCTLTMTVTSDPADTPSTVVSSAAATVMAPVTATCTRPWAGKRRARPASIASVRQDAAASVASVAQLHVTTRNVQITSHNIQFNDIHGPTGLTASD